MIYVAAPYYHKDAFVTQQRMEAVYDYLHYAVKAGEFATSPLLMHSVVVRYKLPETFDFWDNYCLNMLKRCDKMVVLKLVGWDSSQGVKAETGSVKKIISLSNMLI